MIGMPVPLRPSAALMIAYNCGTPTPATIRVVQILPGPTPTFTPLTPASASALAPAAVATLPPMICRSLYSALMRFICSSTPRLWPCAVSTAITSTPTSTRADILSNVSAVTPTAAPTNKRPWLSFAELGWFSTFSISL